MEKKIIWIWQDETVACPPAKRSFNISGLAWITKAILHVEMASKFKLLRVSFNDYIKHVKSNTVDLDVTRYVKLNDVNEVRLDYHTAWINNVDCIWDRADVRAYLELTQIGSVSKMPTEKQLEQKISGLSLKALIFLVVIAIIVVAIAYVTGQFSKLAGVLSHD